MRVIQAPEPVDTYFADVFLAGGISGCSNWQDLVLAGLEGENLVIYNPRRKGDLANTGPEATRQIAWEHAAIAKSRLIAFWFPKETLCPITLFELGKCLKDDIIVGIHPEYARKFDVEQQLRNARPDVNIIYSLNDFIHAIAEYDNSSESEI